MRAINPETVVKPASNYAQGVIHAAGAERMVISGQLGITPEGETLPDLAGQMEQAWRNLFAVMAAGGFAPDTLIRAVIYVTVPGQVGVYREIRDRILDGHLCANTYVEVSGLAAPKFHMEIEGEARK